MGGLAVDIRLRVIIGIVGAFLAAEGESSATPIAKIMGTPASPTNSTSVTLTIGGADVVAYRYRLDGGNYTAEIPSAVAVTLTYLGDGLHTLYVVARDSLGSWQDTRTATTTSWTVDTVEPETFLGTVPPAVAGFSSGSLDFAATEADSLFECKLDTGDYFACTSPWAYDLGAMPDGSHTFSVRARDGAGNIDRTPASYTWSIDTTPPDTAITSGPANPSRDKAGRFVFGSNEAGTFECRMDGTAYATCPSPYDFDFGSAADADHVFSVRAIDRAGNVDPGPAEHRWTIDATAPALTVSALSDGAVTGNATLNIGGAVTDRNGAQLSINGAEVKIAADGTFSHALLLNAGANVIVVAASDPAGNQTVDRRVVTLDQVAPGLSITAPTDNAKVALPLVDVVGTVDEAAFMEIAVNNGAPEPVSVVGSSFSATARLVPGINTIEITAADLLGNRGAQKRTVTLDDQKPSLAVISPGQDIRTEQRMVEITGTVFDPLSDITVTVGKDDERFPSLHAGAGKEVPFRQEVTFDENKVYRLVVTATDEVGNSSSVQRNIIYARPAQGDINNDGKVDLVDALRALEISTGLIRQTDDDLIRGDVAPLVGGKSSPDGRIDVGDAMVILKIAVGLISL